MQTQTSFGQIGAGHIPPMSTAPAGFSIETDLPPGFAAFYRPLHDAFTARQQEALAERRRVLEASTHGVKPGYRAPTEAQGDWRIELPAWCADQRNQMTGPADDHELGVKMLNSGAPGVMIDLEDSMANDFAHHAAQASTIRLRCTTANSPTSITNAAEPSSAIKPSSTVLWTRVRGLHLSQAGIYPRADVGVALRSGAARVQARLLAAEAPARDLHPQDRVGRRSALVARRVPGGRDGEGTRRPLRDQGDGLGRVVSVRIPMRRVRLHAARSSARRSTSVAGITWRR